MTPIAARISRFQIIQKENLFVIQEMKKTGHVPDTHAEYIEYLDRALESLMNLGQLKLEYED